MSSLSSSSCPLPDLIQLSPNIQQVGENEPDPCISSLSVSSTVIAATQLCGNVALFETSSYFDNSNSNGNCNTHQQQQQVPPKPFTTFTAHADALNGSKFLSKVGNGTFLATCSDDSSVRIFDCKNINDSNRGYPIALYPAPAEVNCLCESTDGTKLYAGCDDGSVVVYTYGEFSDATKVHEQRGGSAGRDSMTDSYNSLSPFPNAAPPASIDRFMVGEGSVNDIVVVSVPYGDLVFTATEDGSVRGWRTVPGQRAPNEPSNSQPSREEIERQLSEAMKENEETNGSNNNNNSNNNNSENDGNDDNSTASSLRQMIADSLGDESANRLLTSFDIFKGGQINHLASTTIANDPVLLVAASNYVFAVPFNVNSGQLAEEPAIMFTGNSDFIRGLHPTSNGNLVTVSDDGAVCLYTRNLSNQQEPVEPMRKFQGEPKGLNIMSSAMMVNDSGLVTGSLLGSVKLWKL